jgi:uncharacterized phage protein (TIGR01671 family)
MREILFRGFTPDENGRETITVSGKQIKGEWVQGSYWELRKTTYCFQSDYDRHPDNTEHYIVFDRMTDWGLPNRHLQADVIPETVGQFTGRTDKNCKKVFEHDILQTFTVWADGTVEKCGVGIVQWWENDQCYVLATKEGYHIDDFGNLGRPEYYEVIGNIHDNPELLGGGNEE